ncbi:hypothetical protein [Acinetobacter sp.]|uniref:hypothetical protein n=1 Tax=Acinetobacter sp. TaxID=472 RepID=UPI0035B47442
MSEYLKMSLDQLQKEHAELLAFNENLDRERNNYRDQAKTYKSRNELARSVADSYFRFEQNDPELTVKAMQRALIGTGD